MTLGQSLWVGGNALNPSDARMAFSGLLATNSSDPLDIRQGVLYSGNQNLIAATAGLSVTVSPLHFVGSKAYNNGAYVGCNQSAATVTVPAAPSLGLKRIDVLYAVQQDANALVSADGTTAAVFGVHPGVASSSPNKPALTDSPAAPVGAIEVGTITWDSTSSVPTATNASVVGGSCTIATTCLWTSLRDVPIPVRNTTERAGITAYDGAAVFRLDTGGVEQSFAGAWGSPYINVCQKTASTPPTQNVWTVLSWDTVIESNAFTYSGGVFTVVKPGVYGFKVQYTFTSSSPVVQIGAAVANAATPPVPYRRAFASSMTGANSAVAMETEYRFAAGQQFTLPVITAASGHALETAPNGAGTFASVRWVGP